MSLQAHRHSWEPAFDFCLCLIKIMLILTARSQLCKTKQINVFSTMLLYSSIASLHLLTDNNGKGLMDNKGKVKLSMAVLQTFLQGFQFEKHSCFSGIFTSRFLPNYSLGNVKIPKPSTTLLLLLYSISLHAILSFQNHFSHYSHTYGDPNSLLLWCAGMFLLCEELEKSSPGEGVDKNFWVSI